MSKYNSYAKRVDEIARGLFNEYNKALEGFQSAEMYYKANKRPDYGMWSTDAEKIAIAAEAEAKYQRSKAALEKAKNALNAGKAQIRSIQREFETALDADIRINPKSLDMATVEILKSGVLKPHEYSQPVSDNAENPTMARMIGAYAGQALEKVSDRAERMHLIHAVDESKKVDGGESREAFDNFCTVYDKCVNNPSMISYWNELTGATVENF